MTPARLVRLLRDARHALVMDLMSAGPREVRGNPILRSRQRLVARIGRALAELDRRRGA